MADLIAYSVGDDDDSLTIDGTDGAYSGYAKLFYVPTGYNKITSISFRLKRQYDPEGAVAEIYATSGPSYLPTGESLASVNLPELTTEYAWYSIDFNTDVTSETWYAAVIRSTAAWDPLHYIFWVGQTSPPDIENVGGEPEYYYLEWQSEVGDVNAQIKVYGESGLPEKPINPIPTDAADDVTLDQTTISWEDGGDATSYNVYYGENEGGLTLVSEGQAETSFTISGIDYGSPFDYIISRTWRIDAVNDAGITTGDVWTFTTIAFDPPLPTGVALDAEGNPTGTPTGENNMYTVKRLIVAANNAIWYGGV